MLSVENHDRDVAGLTYVYPVVSRRAGGVSLGMNLSPNNACNWQCVYCQVPDLKVGVSPRVDTALLWQELDTFVAQLVDGDYMQKHVPEGCRVLRDMAFSGNGEPSTCPNFLDAVEVAINIMDKYKLAIPLRLITNGSSVHKAGVQQGLKRMAAYRGEVWFKVDAVDEKLSRAIHGVSIKPDWQLGQLRAVAHVCPVKLQTCLLQLQSEDDTFVESYLTWVEQALAQGIQLEGVLLYGLARPSMQQGGEQLVSAPLSWIRSFAEKIESLGLSVTVS